MKFHHKLIGYALVSIILLTQGNNTLADCNDDIKFLDKSYGELTPDFMAPSYYQTGKYMWMHPSYYSQICRGTMSYVSPSEVPAPKKKKILLEVVHYSDADILRNDILHQMGQMYFVNTNNISIIDTSSNSVLLQKRILEYRHEYKYEWISGSLRVKLSIINLDDHQEALNDYLNKFPPTHKFTEADFNRDAINRESLEKYFRIIEEAEAYRSPFPLRPKYERFLGVMAQCDAEKNLKIKAKMFDELREEPTYGCPIAMNFDNKQRQKKFSEFKERVFARSFDYSFDDINFPDDIVLGEPFLEVSQKLHMTLLDEKQLKESGAPPNLIPGGGSQ
jgi:hypothetical protein